MQHPIIYAIYYCKSMSSRDCGSRISISVIIHYSECKRRSKCHGTVLPVSTVYQNNKCARFFTLLQLSGQFANCFVAIFLTGMKLSHKVFCNHLFESRIIFMVFSSYQNLINLERCKLLGFFNTHSSLLWFHSSMDVKK